MLRFVSFFLLMLASSSFFSQKVVATVIGEPELIFQENGITISSKLVECNNLTKKEVMNFKMICIQNTNESQASVKIKHNIYYDGECRTCNNDEYNVTYIVDAKTILEGTCMQDTNPTLSIFSSMKDGYIKEKLSDVQLQIVRLN